MSNLIIPDLNPIVYHKLTPDEEPQYRSKHFEKYRFVDTIPEWITSVDYGLMFQRSTDSIRQQMTTDYEFSEVDEFQIKLIDVDGNVKYNDTFNAIIQNVDNPDEWVYESTISLPDADLEDGIYFLKVLIGGTVLISEPLVICDVIEESLHLKYKHDSYKGEVFFETGFFPEIRFLGSLNYKTPASKDTPFEDQELNMQLTNSDAFDVWELSCGGSFGVPDYWIKRLNRIFSCSYKAIDGKQYEKAEGAKFELKEIDGYPLKGLRIELVEAAYTSSQVYEL